MTKQKGLREILRDFYKNYYLGQKVQCNFDDAYLVDKTVRQIKALFIFNKDKTFEILDNLKEYIKWQYDGKKVLHGGNLKTMLLLIDEIKEIIDSGMPIIEEAKQYSDKKRVYVFEKNHSKCIWCSNA